MNKASKKAIKLGSMMLGLVFAGTVLGTNAYHAFAAKDGDELSTSTYKLESSSAEDSLDKAKKFNESIAEEGFILLKNENNALPLTEGHRKVNLLGKNWVNPAYGGSGSSSFDANSGSGIDVIQAMKDEGFTINQSLIDFYKDNSLSGTGRPNYSYGASDMVTGETPVSQYGDQLKNTFANFGDANIVMVTRVGGEGYEVSSFYGKTQNQSTGDLEDPVIQGRATPTDEHYLMLDDNEKDLIKMAAEGDKKVILVINAAQTLELHDEDIADVDAIVWVGLPGSTGFAALPRILNGSVNPSGRTADTYARDFYKIPAFQNFSLNEKNAVYEYDPNFSWWFSSGSIKEPAGNAVLSESGDRVGAVVTYEEGIYVGYRYFETRAFEEGKGTSDEWWQANVRYPFGYGLSYTSFSYEKVEFKTESLTKEGTVDVEVTVKNTGSVAGKEVVQFYYSAPYTRNGIEKSHVVLGDFAKTKVIEPGQTDKVTLSIKVEDMASYDFNDANGNDFYGYEVEAGTYGFYVGKNAHDAWYNAPAENKKELTLADGFTYEIDIEGDHDGNDNLFDEVSAGLLGDGIETLSRANFEGTMPEHPDVDERTVGAETAAKFNYGVFSQNDPTGANYDKDQPWYVETMPTQATTELKGDEENIIKLLDLATKSYDDPLWEQFLNQFTVNQLIAFVEQGFFTTQAVEALGIPESKTPDGPFGFVFQAPGHSSNRCYYVSPCIVASTFNKEIARKQGESIGEEGAWMGYNGIYAPGVNIHRTPFSGRNFEYYSEDATLAAVMCREVVAGMQSKGVMPFIKHFALNDQEQDRNGVATFATEQTMREIYLRAFQWAVEDAGALGIMSSFNRIGLEWSGACYDLLTNLLRKEWGFKGTVITDWANGGYMNVDQMIRAGNDLSLSDRGQHVTATSEALSSATHVAAMRQATKNICYSVLHTCVMSKLMNYDDLCVASDQYLYTDKNLNVDFHSETYEKYYEAQGYTVSYEVTKPDAKTEDNPQQDLPVQLPNENVELDSASGIAVVKADGLKVQDYTLCVSIKLTKGEESFYIGQRARTVIHNTGMDQSDYLNQLIEKVTELEGTVTTLQQTITTLQSTIESLTARVTALEGAQGGGTDHSAEIAELQTTIESLQSTVTALQSALKTAQDEIKALKDAQGSAGTPSDSSEVQALKDKITALENKVSELEKKGGGCGGVIGAGSAIIAAITVLGGAALVLKKKSK